MLTSLVLTILICISTVEIKNNFHFKGNVMIHVKGLWSIYTSQMFNNYISVAMIVIWKLNVLRDEKKMIIWLLSKSKPLVHWVFLIE